MSTPRDPAYVTTHHVVVPCYEDNAGGENTIYAPPGLVLDVCVVAERVFLSVCDYEEGSGKTTLTTKEEVEVDATALLNALVTQMGIERVRLAIPFVDESAS